MPFIVTEKNLQKVFAEHLHAGENALVVTMSGARGVLGITDQNRIIHSNFPFFGKPKIKEEYTISEIFSCECTQKNQYTMTLLIDVRGEKKKYNSTISPMVDSKTLANKFAAIILQQNRNARPDYLDSDEDIVEQFSTKKQNVKITNKNIIQFNKDNELVQKTALPEYTLFDFYPGKMDSTNLYFETKKGTKQLYNIGITRHSLLVRDDNNPDNLIANIYQILQKSGEKSGEIHSPEYLKGETLLATLRAGTSKMGAINPSHVLKLTETALIDLKINDDGKLEPTLSIDLNSIDSAKFIRHRGETAGGSIHEIKLVMNDKSKHKYALSGQYIDEISQLQNLIDG